MVKEGESGGMNACPREDGPLAEARAKPGRGYHVGRRGRRAGSEGSAWHAPTGSPRRAEKLTGGIFYRERWATPSEERTSFGSPRGASEDYCSLHFIRQQAA